MKILVDAGHTDNTDPGAVANGTTEHAEVVLIANALVEMLAKDQEIHPHTILLMPTSKTLAEKITYANAMLRSNDLLISIHMNSAGNVSASGCETYYLGGNKVQQQQAHGIQRQLSDVMQLKDRGCFPDTKTRHGRLGIIRDVRSSAFLLELGFITNPMDLARARKVGALAAYRAIRGHLGLVVSEDNPGKKKKQQILELETGIDNTLSQVDGLLSKLEIHLEEWKRFDVEIDGKRGALLALLEEHDGVVGQDVPVYEKTVMKKYLLQNNDLLDELEQYLEKRKEWHGKISRVREVIVRKLKGK